jgi:hypothetical protein
MKTNESRSARTRRLGALTLLGLVSAGAGCLTPPIDPLDTRTTWTAHFKQVKSGVNKIDLLLMLDNSGSMADKQAILADAVPSLVKGLLDPPCVGNDDQPIANQPKSPADDCPAGSAREFQPVLDVHIGIVTSSLGGHSAAVCQSAQENDQGHLVSRTDAMMPANKVDTYKSLGFLAWDPKQALVPPGEGDLDTTVGKLREMVQGAGQIGCGFESQLESWYRFLVEPEPYATITRDMNGNAVQGGLDQDLLDERAAFLRPDSMVAVLMLTDENDCSTRESGQSPLSNDPYATMPRARQECEKDTNDRCCAPCGHAPGDCPVDAKCEANPKLEASEDPYNLRCWDQKRRFGVDFLYPVDRYTGALTAAQIPKRDGQLVDNPLYPADPDGTLNARNPSTGLVFIAGIVGVPWQDIARQRADGTPDLLAGLDVDGKPVGGFMSAAELTARDPETHQARWDVILGDPAKGVLPLDPLMRESRKPRSGKNPITGAVVADPGATSPDANAINGHEWNTDTAKQGGVPNGDLQYACVFELETPRDCATATTTCDCTTADTDGSENPLCQSASGAYTKVQRRAKGYPGVRELEVLKGAGEQGIVASVCPAQVTNPMGRDYGYSPAIGAIIDRLKHKLTGQCLPRPLTPRKDDGKVACVIIEASKSADTGACCSGKARHAVTSDHAEALTDAKNDPSSKGNDCFCEIDQLGGDDLKTCQTDTDIIPVSASNTPVDGWCYVDQTTGAPSLVDGCAAGEKYKVRFVGAGQPGGEALTFITCAGGGN